MSGWTLLAAVFGLATLPGTVELALVTVGGLLPPRRRRPRPDGGRRRLAVVVPAHNEADGIARCVASLRACEPPSDAYSVVVVADNCTDATAERAAAAGARVLERHDTERRGKGYALEFAFDLLLAEGVEAIAVVDADTVVEAGFVAEVRTVLAEGADAVQTRYGVLNPEASLRTRLMNVALLAFNVLRPRGRDRWGLSVGILGNGFALTADTLRAVPYTAHSVVEDVEYHLALVRAGRAVRFVDRTTVRADMPVGGHGVRTQRARWEGGRLRMIAEMAPPLLREVVAGRRRLLEPLLELLLLPLAFHVALLGLALLVPVAASRIYACVGLGVVAVHVLGAVAVGGGGMRDLAALLAAPGYIVWKVALVPAIARASRKGAAWVRTERHGANGGDAP